MLVDSWLRTVTTSTAFSGVLSGPRWAAPGVKDSGAGQLR